MIIHRQPTLVMHSKHRLCGHDRAEVRSKPNPKNLIRTFNHTLKALKPRTCAEHFLENQATSILCYIILFYSILYYTILYSILFYTLRLLYYTILYYVTVDVGIPRASAAHRLNLLQHDRERGPGGRIVSPTGLPKCPRMRSSGGFGVWRY